MFFHEEENKITEKEIQILYQTHPYLIEKEFLGQQIIPQYSLISGFADIVVILENEVVIIELKVEYLNFSHLLQLNGYLEDMKKIISNETNIRGILIGKPPKDDLNNAISNLKFTIKLMILNRDVCISIKICNKCRLANDANNSVCEYCSCSSFL
ncbi:hypothetical protein LCGC14_0901230 [marine sediment metagenome]|uniref:Endonuclease NucS C-terminal domain-containing protein n=1 Tax=marine sediment metagenome TaxID=412755 RepID=A0A0F9RFI4_9ZZZZ|nr:MAG: Endonuclease NucS [Candidatus Lokiarchaeum sp. GC14_75]HEA70570.1 DUF91 domain-containing protein [archaeon]